MSLIDDGYMTSRAPWAEGHGRYHGSKPTSLHYRGWTLIDLPNGRYAVEDCSNCRVKVCRLRTEQRDALAMFRDKVDEMIGEP